MIDFEKEYIIDKRLKEKYDLSIKRIENNEDKKDALILFEGEEGSGKSNHAVAYLQYVAQKTGREFVNENVKFTAEEMIEKAKTTKRKIFCWDEPALKALKRMWWDKVQMHLVQLLMMARKNQHLFVFNICDFSKFNEYIIRRAIFMLRIYQRSESEDVRRFLYYPRKKLRHLHDDWNRKHRRLYLKYHTLHGTMPNKYILPKIIDEELYEADKDKAIRSIGEEDENKLKGSVKLLRLQYAIAQIIKDFNLSREETGKYLGIDKDTISKWLRISEKHKISLITDDDKSAQPPLLLINNRASKKNKLKPVSNGRI